MAEVSIPKIPKRPESGYANQHPVLPVRSIGERARNGTTKRANAAELFSLEKPSAHMRNCHDCRHRLDVTLWGVWLASGCRLELVLCSACPARMPALTEKAEVKQ